MAQMPMRHQDHTVDSEERYQRIDPSLIVCLSFQIQLHLSGSALRTDGTLFILVLVNAIWLCLRSRDTKKSIRLGGYEYPIAEARQYVGRDAISAAHGAHA
jgi:hypothetical protein